MLGNRWRRPTVADLAEGQELAIGSPPVLRIRAASVKADRARLGLDGYGRLDFRRGEVA
jgi:hypothetical protein